MRKISILIAIIFVLGCSKNESEDPKDPTRTVIAYFIADNNLYSSAVKDINEMESAWDDATCKGNMLVLLNGTGGTNILYHIKKGTDSEKIESDIVRVYSTGSEVCSKEFLIQVINDAIAMYPADSYALDLWSHGRGWLPENQKSPLTIEDEMSKYFYGNEIKPCYEFGIDNYNDGFFEVNDLADALSAYKFDFIFFDACHMGSIECAYEMKDICDYYISSAAETLKDGAPYDQILQDMFAQPANTVGIAQKFYEHYNALTGSERTATISVVDCDQLETVAAELKNIVTEDPSVPILSIQQFGRYAASLDNCIFDLSDFVTKTWGTTSTSFTSALSDAVIYKASTPMILNSIEVNTFCGLSSYIPQSYQSNTYSIFKQYKWAKDSGLDKMVN